MRDFHTLLVCQRANTLTLDLYRASQSFPVHERYGLTSQVRRAAASIGANLAEGCGYDSAAEFARFVAIALGSASELEHHLLLAYNLSYLTSAQFQALSSELVEVKRMLTGLRRRLRQR